MTHSACRMCPLRKFPVFAPLDESEVVFMEQFRRGEIAVAPRSAILREGESSPHLYTVLRGQGLRYKALEDGGRQVLGFIFPGDFIGLQSAVMNEMQHSAEAATPMTLCVFDRSDLWRLFAEQPARAFDLTCLGAIEEHFLGETIASLGRRNATERVAWALVRIHQRLAAVGLERDGAVPFPFRQQDLADALGLSHVHLNKTLARLRAARLCNWANGHITACDLPALARIAMIDLEAPLQRPLI
ncbi:MAG: Crp/Fnr family transcriptional regulator [Gemmobacter sp.]